jgi:hypothetical protein
MFTCPTRAPPPLAATASPTVPDASPDCPSAIVIQPVLLEALQRHPASVVTATLTWPPPSAIVSPVRDKEKMQGAACWLTATLLPPTTIDAERGEGTGLAATEYATLASPWPLRSPPIATQVASLAIDHVQSRAVVIVKDPCPPGGGNDDGLVVTVTSHRLAAADGAVIDVSVLVQAADTSASDAASVAARRVKSVLIGLTRASHRKRFASSADGRGRAR